MKFLEKLRKLGKKGKIAISTSIATMSMAAMACVASAAETSETNTDLVTVLGNAGDQMVSSFGDMVTTMIPVAMNILGTGLVIYGVIYLIKFGKQIFGKVVG